jgi:hypothetical protein
LKGPDAEVFHLTTKELQERTRRFSPLLAALAVLALVSQLAFVGFSWKFDAAAKVEADVMKAEQAKLTTSSYLSPPVTVSTTTTVAR